MNYLSEETLKKLIDAGFKTKSKKVCSCEILEQLPTHVSVFHLGQKAIWFVDFIDFESIPKKGTHFENVSLVEAVADLWLWCKKEGYLK